MDEFGSVRSVTTAGVISVFGNPFRGRNRSNQAANSPAGRILRIRSASIRAGEKKSSPPGSQAAG